MQQETAHEARIITRDAVAARPDDRWNELLPVSGRMAVTTPGSGCRDVVGERSGVGLAVPVVWQVVARRTTNLGSASVQCSCLQRLYFIVAPHSPRAFRSGDAGSRLALS